MPSQEKRLCLECGEPFNGRMDKKFCSDLCRISFNNRINNEDIQYVRSINNILRRNRRILMSLNPTGKNKVTLENLKAKGFDFQYFTSTYKTREGARYFYCYEQGYLPLDGNQCLLVIKKEFQQV
jgi:hypothetical protein